MGLFSRARRKLFPTMGEMAQDVTQTAASMAAGMKVAMDEQMRARGLKPCSWCSQYTDGAVGGTKVFSRGVALFCSEKCRSEFDLATQREPVTCGYCAAQYPGGLGQCPSCGADRKSAR